MGRDYTNSRGETENRREPYVSVTGVSDSDILTLYYIIYGIPRPYIVTSESDF